MGFMSASGISSHTDQVIADLSPYLVPAMSADDAEPDAERCGRGPALPHRSAPSPAHTPRSSGRSSAGSGRADAHRSPHCARRKRRRRCRWPEPQEGAPDGPVPSRPGRAGSKHHLITDGHGTPLAVILTDGNRNDVTQLMPLLDAIPAVRGRPGQPRRKPQAVFADRGYDHDIYRDQVRARRIIPVIARRGTPHGSGLGVYRWVVERTFAWLHGFKRLRVRWERRADIHEASSSSPAA